MDETKIVKGADRSITELVSAGAGYRLSTPKTVRDSRWFEAAKRGPEIHRKFKQILRSGVPQEGDLALVLLATSIAFDGAIDPSMFSRIVIECLRPQDNLKFDGASVFLEIDIDLKTGSALISPVGKLERRFAFSSRTLSILKTIHEKELVDRASITSREIHSALEEFYGSNVLCRKGQKFGFSGFCIAVSWVLEQRVDAPIGLLEVANGTQRSVDLHSGAWSARKNPRHDVSPPIDVQYLRSTRVQSRKRLPSLPKRQDHELISRAVRVPRKGKDSSDAMRQVLEAAHAAASTDAARLLIEYFVHLLEIGDKPSTIRRYSSALCAPWLQAAGDGVIDGWERDLFHETLKHIEKIAADGMLECEEEYAKRRFLAFLLWLGGKDLIDIEEMPSEKFQKRLSVVRNEVIWGHEYLAARRCIKGIIGISNSDRRHLEVMLILGYRLGLRSGELQKLRVSDIRKLKSELTIDIRSNQYGSNKSLSARRTFDLRPFLTIDEYQFVCQWYEIAKQSSHISDQRIFRFSARVSKSNRQKVACSLIGAVLRHVTARNVRFHSLRHSALNNLFLVSEGELELAAIDAGICVEQLEKLRLHCFVRKRDRYMALATIAGHRSPNTTFAHYMHRAFEIWQGRVLQADILSVSLTGLARLARLQMKTVERLTCDGENGGAPYVAEIAHRLRIACCDKSEQGNVNIGTQGGSAELAGTVEFGVVAKLLELVDAGHPLRQAAVISGHPLVNLDQTIETAKIWSNEKTRKGKPRLVRSAMQSARPIGVPRSDRPSRTKDDRQLSLGILNISGPNIRNSSAVIAPQAAGSHEVASELLLLEDYFVEVWSSFPDLTKSHIRCILGSTNCSTSGYRMLEPVKVKSVVDWLQPVIPKDRWHVEIDCSMQQDSAEREARTKYWTKAGIATDRMSFRPLQRVDKLCSEGPASLHLLSRRGADSSATAGKKWHKYSSNSLTIAAHLAVIAFGIQPN